MACGGLPPTRFLAAPHPARLCSTLKPLPLPSYRPDYFLTAYDPHQPTAPSITVLERGWLSANNILFMGLAGAAVVDTGYCTPAEQTWPWCKGFAGRPPLQASSTPTCTATTAVATPRCRQAWPGATTPSRPARWRW